MSALMSRRRLVLLLIVAIAAGVRLAYIPAHRSQREAEASVHAGELARAILAHGRWLELNDRALALVEELGKRKHWLINPGEVNFTAVDASPQWQPVAQEEVGAGIMLAGVWELTGSERFLYGEILQIAVDSLMVLLIYRIVVLLFRRRRAALLAAAVYAVFPPIAQHTVLVTPDIWAVDFTIATVATYLEAMRSSQHRLRWLLVCGVTLGVGMYFRPNLLVLPAALALASASRHDWRRHLRYAAAVSAVAAVVVSPWTAINYGHFHRFIPTRTGLGVTLWIGLSEIHNGYGVNGNEDVIREEVHRARPDLVYNTPEYDDYLRAKAIHLIERHPLYYAELVARRVLLSTAGEYESGWMHANGESPFLYRTRTGHGLASYVINRPFNVLEDALQPLVFVIAMLALILTWRGRRREHVFLIAVVLATLVPYWIIHSETRYVLPASLAYIIWISVGADVLAERVAARVRARSAGESIIGWRSRTQPATPSASGGA
jgi:4-amino-4-deoxy-L-arabinose transferase-like glycosyltransferase